MMLRQSYWDEAAGRRFHFALRRQGYQKGLQWPRRAAPVRLESPAMPSAPAASHPSGQDGSPSLGASEHSGSLHSSVLLGLVVLLLSLVIGWLTPGYEGDMNQNKGWARTLVRNGMHDAYRSNIDYPPVPLYMFAASGWVYQTFVDPSFNER